MSTLAELQDHFQDYLLNSNHTIESFINESQSVSTETRLAIYHHAYRSRLLEALSSSYPVLHAYMGEIEFEKLGNHYLSLHPSCNPSIRWFGDQLTTVLSHLPPYDQIAHLSELACVEWTLTLVFDAADQPILSIEEMGAIPPHAWPTLRFETHPSLHQLDLYWNTMAIWQALSDDQAPPEPVQGPAIAWIFWRHELINRFCSLAEDEKWAIQALINQANFGDICEGLCQWVSEDDAPMRAATLLKDWISAGLISKVMI